MLLNTLFLKNDKSELNKWKCVCVCVCDCQQKNKHEDNNNKVFFS